MSADEWTNWRGTMRVGLVVAVGGLVIAPAAPLRGQSATPSVVSVHGIAFDSLRSVPLEGAFIRMAGTAGGARTATSDARGQFVFDGVPPGTYSFSMLHEALDSLGLGGITTRATVGDPSPTVRLSIPSFATMWHAACGRGAVPADTGFVFGTIRDADRGVPLANATVVVRWIALGVERGSGPGAKPGVTEQAWGGEARSDSAGSYSLCGVPSDATLRLLARKDSASSGLLELLPRGGKTPRVERRDMSIAPSGDSAKAKRGVVAGLVRNADGQPVADARVIAESADEVRTSVDGRFVIPNVPIGTREVAVMSIGAQPVTAAADVTTRDTAFVAIELRKIVELAPVVVTAKTARQRMLAEIEERRALGLGHFMDSAQVAPFMSLEYATRMMIGSSSGCLLFLDGVPVTDARDVKDVVHLRNPLGIALVEAHRGTDPALPLRYKSAGRRVCDRPTAWVILVWTKNWLP